MHNDSYDKLKTNWMTTRSSDDKRILLYFKILHYLKEGLCSSGLFCLLMSRDQTLKGKISIKKVNSCISNRRLQRPKMRRRNCVEWRSWIRTGEPPKSTKEEYFIIPTLKNLIREGCVRNNDLLIQENWRQNKGKCMARIGKAKVLLWITVYNIFWFHYLHLIPKRNDRLAGIMVSMSDWHPRGLGFDSRQGQEF